MSVFSLEEKKFFLLYSGAKYVNKHVLLMLILRNIFMLRFLLVLAFILQQKIKHLKNQLTIIHNMLYNFSCGFGILIT